MDADAVTSNGQVDTKLEPDAKRQRMNEGDVLAMKETGASAKQIIDKLVAG